MKRTVEDLAQDTFDVLVVGGGVHGACAAWDAAQRGLTVALVERGDFGGETSANSLKTIHGGLRYLQDADISLVRSMIHERSAWLRIAAHLVHPLPCLMPTDKSLTKGRLAMSVAARLNDLIGYDRNRELPPDNTLPPTRLISRQECLDILPGLPAEGLTGGVIWYDGQVYNTERLTLSLVKSACRAGAVVANYVEAVRLLRQGDRVVGVSARDGLTGQELEIRAKVVLNAAGPWVDLVLEGIEKPGEVKFHHSLAMNLVTRRLIDHYGVGINSRPDGLMWHGEPAKRRLLFVAPWREYSIVGTLHDHYTGGAGEIEIEEAFIQCLVDEINSAYPPFRLRREDVCFVHRGLLPVRGASKNGAVRLIREGQVYEHSRQESVKGLVTMVGVKFTSARKVAELAVDSVCRELGRKASQCQTGQVRLADAPDGSFGDFLKKVNRESPPYLSKPLVEDLARSYGSEYPDLIRLIQPPDEGRELLAGSPQVVEAQTTYAVRSEMANKLADVVLRRTSLGSAGPPAEAAFNHAAQVMSRELGWGQSKTENEKEETRAIYRRTNLNGEARE